MEKTQSPVLKKSMVILRALWYTMKRGKIARPTGDVTLKLRAESVKNAKRKFKLVEKPRPRR